MNVILFSLEPNSRIAFQWMRLSHYTEYSVARNKGNSGQGVINSFRFLSMWHSVHHRAAEYFTYKISQLQQNAYRATSILETDKATSTCMQYHNLNELYCYSFHVKMYLRGLISSKNIEGDVHFCFPYFKTVLEMNHCCWTKNTMSTDLH